MKTSSAKAKGRRLAQNLQKRLLEAFPELTARDIRVTPSGVTGADLQLSEKAVWSLPFDFECKNQERVNIWAAFEQAQAYATLHRPILVISRNRVKEPLVCMTLTDFIGLLK